MTREEAIKVLQTEIACVKRQDCARIECAKCDLVLEESAILTAYDMAIAALREQEERSKGCEYCNGLPELQRECFTMPNASKQDYDIVTIRYCPMCGRRLEEV